MVVTSKSQRIEFIDLMKGICITLVVIVHCDVKFPMSIINDMLQNLRMPLYFFLTGIFFKEYNSFGNFFFKKINKLVIPYLFFALFPYIIFDLFINPNVEKSFVYYLFMVIEPYNFPLWFLRSLFISYMLFYAINKITRNRLLIKCFVIILLSFVSWKVSFILPKGGWAFLLENFVTSLFALPFLLIATLARKEINNTFNTKLLALYFILGVLAWIICAQDNVFFVTAHFGNTYPLLYLSALGGIACLWVICYQVKRLFFFSYVGRYSIVVLGTFAPIIHFLHIQYGLTGWAQALVTLTFMPAMIYILTKFFPYFTAQKDLIRYKVT